jgi:hypothetical protein
MKVGAGVVCAIVVMVIYHEAGVGARAVHAFGDQVRQVRDLAPSEPGHHALRLAVQVPLEFAQQVLVAGGDDAWVPHHVVGIVGREREVVESHELLNGTDCVLIVTATILIIN